MDLVEQDQQTPAAFDLSALDPALAKSLQARTERITAAYRKTVESFAEIGRELIAAQAELKHGEFAAWMETLPLGRATAYRTMEMSRNLGAEIRTVRHLPLTVVQKLAAAPEPVRVSVIQRMKDGEAVQPAAILEEVQTAKDQDRERRTEEKEAARRARLTQEQRDLEDARNKRDAKSKALKERHLQKEHDERQRENEVREAARQEACAFLLDIMGADKVAAFAERYGHLEGTILRRSGDAAQAERASRQEVVTLTSLEIHTAGLSTYYMADEDREQVKNLKQDIKENGLKTPLLVVWNEEKQLYRILDGRKRYLAIPQNLQIEGVPVRIAPPLDVDAALATPQRSANTATGVKLTADVRQTAGRNGQAAARSEPASEPLPIMDWIKDGKG